MSRPVVGHTKKIVIRIRDAVEEDLPRVADLWEELARYHESLSEHFRLAWDSKRRWSEYLRTKFSEPSTKLIVAEEDGRLVGFMLCLLSPNAPIYKERKVGVVSDVFVQEPRRRKGVAKKMLASAIQWFRKNKVSSVQLAVAHDNIEARLVWRKLGFEPYMVYERLDLDDLDERKLRTPRRVVVKKVKRGSVARRVSRGPS